jgi:hypothetical protein
VKKIGQSAFYCCSGLTQLEFGSSVTTIGRSSFKGCSSLTQLELPSSLAMVAHGAFEGCSGLTQLVFPSSVTVIEDSAFSSCTGLTGLEIAPGVISIGGEAFQGCSDLAWLEIPSSFRDLGDGVFAGVARIEQLTLVGSVLSPAVVAAVEGCLLSSARVVDPALAGRKLGFFRFGMAGWAVSHQEVGCSAISLFWQHELREVWIVAVSLHVSLANRDFLKCRVGGHAAVTESLLPD